MLRAYQLSMVRPSDSHHTGTGTGPWSLKDRSDTSSGARGQNSSTHILGVGIVLVGILILSVGLIMGLEFPKYVHEKTKESQCVVYDTSDAYKSWVNGTQWTRKIYLYYWTMESDPDDFLDKGGQPRFKQIGPYIYTEKESKYDVHFSEPVVTYRVRHTYTYDKDATKDDCNDCSEHDRIRVLNPWYIREVSKSGGEENFALSLVPDYINRLLIQNALLDDGLFRSNISILGDFNSSSDISDDPILQNISIGLWIRQNDPSGSIPKSRNGVPFSSSETAAVYNILGDVSLLGGSALASKDVELLNNCETFAESLCSSPSVLSKLNLGVSECGIVQILRKCHSRNSTSQTVRDFIHDVFCPEAPSICLNLSHVPDTVLLAYIQTFSSFFDTVSNDVITHFRASTQMDFVITRNQSDLALGYDVTDGYVTYHVAGFLDSDWILLSGSQSQRPMWKEYTCLKDRKMDYNMKLFEYNQLTHIPKGLLRENEVPSHWTMESHTDFLTPCPSLRTCVTCWIPDEQPYVFMAELLRPVTFTGATTMSYSGEDVVRYSLDPGTFTNNSHLKVGSGLQDMSDVTGFPVWISKPSMSESKTEHFLVQTNSASTDDADRTQSYITVEPVTGRIWEKDVKLQWNVGVDQQSARAFGRNIRNHGLPFPVFWLHKKMEVTANEIADYKHLVSRLMAVSCGGVIGFSIVAVIIVILGVAICLYPSKPNRVAPVVEEASSNGAVGGRHV